MYTREFTAIVNLLFRGNLPVKSQPLPTERKPPVLYARQTRPRFLPSPQHGRVMVGRAVAS